MHEFGRRNPPKAGPNSATHQEAEREKLLRTDTQALCACGWEKGNTMKRSPYAAGVLSESQRPDNKHNDELTGYSLRPSSGSRLFVGPKLTAVL